MSRSHLIALEQALSQKGWRIAAVHPGDSFGISATLEIQRSTKHASLLIDFDGLELIGRFCHPLDKSYGCSLRASDGVSLRFSRINKRRELWQRELAAFVDALDSILTGDSVA
jgi:hypothetical protein